MNEPRPEALPAGSTEPPPETIPASTDSLPAASAPTLRYPPAQQDPLEEEFKDVQRVGVFYGAMLLPILVATGWRHHAGSNAVEFDFWASGGLYAVIAVYATVWRREWWDLVCWPAGRSRRWLIAVGLTPLVTIGAAELLHHGAIIAGFPVEDVMAGFGEGGYPLWLLALWLVVLAPVFEEIAFRGVLMARLQRVMSPNQAIWVAATLFGVVHFNVLGMAVFLVPLAGVAGYLTRETKSLLPAIAIHAAHNAGIFLLSL